MIQKSRISHLESTKQQKLLCIVGPTGTGKTKLAIELSHQFPSDLISADSRQAYRRMDIVTGKDHPAGIEMAGIDIVDPDEECSVAVWHDAVAPMLATDKLPIVVGGTGLYVRAMIVGIETMDIPPNDPLRKELNTLSLSELQSRLRTIAEDKFSRMNNSDQNNPRRLIRAVEIAQHRTGNATYHPQGAKLIDTCMVGLLLPQNETYKAVVRERVIERITAGAIEETSTLLTKYDKNLPSMTAIGYRSIIQFLDGELTESQMIDKWTADELNYAKRQMTWFRKVLHIQWFDADNAETPEQIAKLVSKWYAN